MGDLFRATHWTATGAPVGNSRAPGEDWPVLQCGDSDGVTHGVSTDHVRTSEIGDVIGSPGGTALLVAAALNRWAEEVGPMEWSALVAMFERQAPTPVQWFHLGDLGVWCVAAGSGGAIALYRQGFQPPLARWAGSDLAPPGEVARVLADTEPRKRVRRTASGAWRRGHQPVHLDPALVVDGDLTQADTLRPVYVHRDGVLIAVVMPRRAPMEVAP